MSARVRPDAPSSQPDAAGHEPVSGDRADGSARPHPPSDSGDEVRNRREPPAADTPSAPTSLFGIMVTGILVVLAGFGSFLGWACFASLDSAALARGVVIVHGQRKTVQHLEGGILKALHVAEGDHVDKGQLLLELESTSSQAALDQVRAEYWAALARTERLRAERDGSNEIAFSDGLREAAQDPAVAQILDTERSLLLSRRATRDGRLAVNAARVAQLREEIRALEAQAEARRQQLSINKAELEKLEALIKRGYESQARGVERRLDVAELTGEYAELLANVGKARQAIKETELSSVSLENDRVTEIYGELDAAQRQVAELAERRRAAEDVVRRTKVVAPRAGLVTNLRIFTIGGVIGAGQPILDIVPDGEQLIVEAKVNPKDIDSVRVDLPARVRLTAYRQRVTPTVDGKVTHVSADMLIDERSGASYFLTRVTLDPDSLSKIHKIQLYPGMPAEVMVTTGSRKAIDYFLAPFTDVMTRALREE